MPHQTAILQGSTSPDATALWLVQPGTAELREESLPPLAADDTSCVEVKTLYSAISRGTEALVFHGRVPESEHQRMRAPFQQGEFPAPVKYGYSNVGTVINGPDALINQTVFCLFPHQDRYQVPVSAVQILPESTPASRAVLAANMETAINGVWDASPLPGERVSVVGAGVVGALVAYLCQRIIGTDVQLIDINPARQALADSLGVRFSMPEQAVNDQDLVIHASGHADGLATALTLAGREARIIEMSWFGEGNVSVPLGGAFHSRRLTLRASQVGQLPPHQQPRWDYARRLQFALRLLEDPRLDALISGETPFARLPEQAPALLAANSQVLCQRIVY
ncbi:MAG: zinc-binding alcohol dehydrogenase [Halomonas sp.]|nr:zinc-binding alcohol dehydrogenase [Halomonas sp.]TVM07271.1 MAG: zinc-binding alcohol dehydrogenase [Halomonas sp.]